MSEVIQVASLEAAFKANHAEIKALIEKADGEIKVAGTVASETKQALEVLSRNGEEIGKRIDKVEAKLNRKGDGPDAEGESIGSTFVKSDGFKALQSGHTKQHRIAVKQIVNATGQNQPLVPAQRLSGIIAEPTRRFTIRDLIPTGRTNSNLIEYTKENVFTNAAAPQYEASPERFEAVRKAQSTITFTQATAAVVTLAHFIKASKQVLSDAPALESYINGRLIYGLKLEEEDEVLNGTGASGELSGLWANATDYNRSADTNDTILDKLRKAITQSQVAEYSPSGFILNPRDWETVELKKDTQLRYLVGDPTALMGPRIWGLPVVVTNSMPAGRFMVGAFDMAAMIWDREDASVQVGFENDDFTKNLVTILCEERLALTVFRALSLVKGQV